MNSFLNYSSQFFQGFNNREISISIWIVLFPIFIIYTSKKESITPVKKAIKEFFKTLINKYLIVHFSFLILYTITGCFILNLIGFWDFLLLKDSIFFFFILVGVSSSWITNKNESVFLKNILKDSLKINLLVVLLDFYPLPLLIELIIFPIGLILYLMILVSEKDPKLNQVKKMFSFIFTMFGLIILFFTLKEFYSNYKKILDPTEWKSNILPIILTFWSIPALYITTLIARYDMAINMVSHQYRSKSPFKWKWSLIKHCGFNIKRIEKFNKIPFNEKGKVNSNEDFIKLIKSKIP